MPSITAVAEAVGWNGALDTLAERIAPRFCRPEACRRARQYLAGLLAPVECKNGWQLAEAAGDASPVGVQRQYPHLCRMGGFERTDAQGERLEPLRPPEKPRTGRPGTGSSMDSTA